MPIKIVVAVLIKTIRKEDAPQLLLTYRAACYTERKSKLRHNTKLAQLL